MFFKSISQHIHKQLNWKLLLHTLTVSSKEGGAGEASQTEQSTVAGQNSASRNRKKIGKIIIKNKKEVK